MDLALNSDFSVHLDDRNDLTTVEGVAAFEQSVSIYLQSFLYEATPDFLQRETATDKIRLEVVRVARQHGELDSIDTITIERDPDHDGVFRVEIDYLGNVETYVDEVEA